MIAASTYLPRVSSSTIAASSIQGTGAQNLATAMRSGCSAVSGIELGPEAVRRVCASVAVRPPTRAGSGANPTVAGAALTEANPPQSAPSQPGASHFQNSLPLSHVALRSDAGVKSVQPAFLSSKRSGPCLQYSAQRVSFRHHAAFLDRVSVRDRTAAD